MSETNDLTKISPTVSELIIELKECSGFMDKELAELIGTSPLSIHMCISGFAFSKFREERVRELHRLIFELPARSSKAKKNMMLDETNGESLFSKFSNVSLNHKRVFLQHSYFGNF